MYNAATSGPRHYLFAESKRRAVAAVALRKEELRKFMTRRVILYPGEDGYVVAEVPSLPGCVSQGKTREEALTNIKEAIALHIEVLQERGETAWREVLGDE
jgi:predicted RNase H-like HicB family nuclease